MVTTTKFSPGALYLHGDRGDRVRGHFCDHCDAFLPEAHLPHGTLEGDVKRLGDTIAWYGLRDPPRPNLFHGIVVPRPTRRDWVRHDRPLATLRINAHAMGLSAFRYYDTGRELRALVAWALEAPGPTPRDDLLNDALLAFNDGRDEAKLTYEPHWFYPALHPDEEGLSWAEMCELSDGLDDVA